MYGFACRFCSLLTGWFRETCLAPMPQFPPSYVTSVSQESNELIHGKCVEQCLARRGCYKSVCFLLILLLLPPLSQGESTVGQNPLPFQASKSKPRLVWNQYCRFQNFRASSCIFIPSSFKMSFPNRTLKPNCFLKKMACKLGLGFRNNYVSSPFLFSISKWCNLRAVQLSPSCIPCCARDKIF